MNTRPSLSERWASYISRRSTLGPATYLSSLVISVALFAVYCLGNSGSSRLYWPAVFFLFIGILYFERSGFRALLQSRDAEIAELRGKLGGPA